MPRHLPTIVLGSALLAFVVFGVPEGGWISQWREGPRVADPIRPGQRDAITKLRQENRELRARVDALAALQTRVDHNEGRLAELSSAPSALPLHAMDAPETVEFCGEPLPLSNADTRLRFENEWNRFLVNRHWVIGWMRRSRDAFPLVSAKLAAAGLPDDLKYVMTIESAIDARATSTAGAVGYWQFIGSTGRQYGLERTTLVDDRRNLAKATDAAIAYLTKLYTEFGSWPLALAAYNAGESRVRSEIEQQGTRDYFRMALPRETEAYVFKAAAVKLLFEHPERYGFVLPNDGWKPLACDTITLRVKQARLEFKDIALKAGLDYRELKELNPFYRTSHLPRGDHELVLPRTSLAAVLAAFPTATVTARDSRGIAGDLAVESAVTPTDPPSAPPH